ncbi:MAG: DNA/RNA nuclease SfsA [Candidatus Caldarchaeum sp.]|nr:DNA/RNA nuclease SfsA [Candidatus Caldarchaeum sp.]
MFLSRSDDGIPLYRLDLVHSVFVKRLNRFVCVADVQGDRKMLRLTNTGRLRDLLIEGAEILYRRDRSSKTEGVVVGVMARDNAALIDTREQARAFEAAFYRKLIPWLESFRAFRREASFQGSRFDYAFVYGDQEAFLELKSAVYLREDGAAMYPDTVSVRGRTHIEKLTKIAKTHPAYVVFVAAHPDAKFFTPCDQADPMIRPLLIKARNEGVVVKAVQIFLSGDHWVVWRNSDLRVSLD